MSSLLATGLPRRSSTNSVDPSCQPKSAHRNSPVIPLTADPYLADIQLLSPQGLLHSQKRLPREDITGAWEKCHVVSAARTRLAGYLAFDDVKIDDEEDASYEKVDNNGVEDDEKCLGLCVEDEAGFVSLLSQPEEHQKTQSVASTGSFIDPDQMPTTYLGAQCSPPSIEEQFEEPTEQPSSVYKWGDALGTWAKNARSRIAANGGEGSGQQGQPEAQRLAQDFVYSLLDATHERRPTEVISYYSQAESPQYDLAHLGGCLPGILKPSTFRVPSDESPQDPVAE